MRTIPEVEAAKELMNDAMTWSVMKWLREKKRVRKAADRANELLDQANLAVKKAWGEPLRVAYSSLNGSGRAKLPTDQSLVVLAKAVNEIDENARRARLEAEETFDRAEKQLSTALAREGCRKAIQSWELHEVAIRKAEAAASEIENKILK